MKTVFTILIICFSVYSSSAQPGTPDKSFGDNGVFLDTTVFAFCNALSIQPDGKILTGGNGGFIEKPGSGGLCVARYNSNGSIDESFGQKGKFIIAKIPGAQPQSVRNIVVLPDDKILVCGYFTVGALFGHPGLLRLFKDGKIDSSFGTNGFVTIYLSEWGDATAGMAVQADGKIIVAGNKYIADLQPGPDFLLRYLPDGTPDESFGVKGQVFTYYTSNVRIGAMLLQPDEKIIVGDVFGGATQQFQLTRYNNDGTLDKEFGINGIARINPVSSFLSRLNSLAMQDDGKIIAAGLYDIGPSMALARFNANGTTDSAFGNLGLGYTYFYTPDVYAAAKSVFVTKDKKILLTGNYGKSAEEQVAIVQYNNNGTVDSSFGENGIATGGFPESEYGGSDLSSGVGLLQPDGKIIVSGSFLKGEDDVISNVALFRYNGDLTQKQILIAKIRRWIQHHNGIEWDYNSNISTYVVQRSYDGISFTTIHAGNTSTYTYEDALPLNNTSYYRLQTTSVNGDINYSNVIVITNNYIKISPNPATNILRIQGLPSNQKIKLTVVDFSGNVAISQELTANSNSSYTLNIASLKQGNYLLKIETNDDVVTKKFVKE